MWPQWASYVSGRREVASMSTKLLGFVTAVFFIVSSAYAATSEEATSALTRAVEFMHQRASVHGGYVYRYSADFTLREAEGIPDAETIWIQPPATPAVGDAMLEAYEATGDKHCLEAACDAARALARTQLESGGWDYSGHFDPANRQKILYRRDVKGALITREKVPSCEAGWHMWKVRKYKNTNYSTMDDDVTQAATRLLLRVDQALCQKDLEIHEAARFAVHTLIATQYPCGAWSACFDQAPMAPAPESLYPVQSASFPADWPRRWPKDFTGCYVTNDNLHATAMKTMLLASELASDKEALASARRAGDFLLRAQLPEPQPAWAQQYDAAMQPVWSRAFEPSAISGRESQSAIWALLYLADFTKDKSYLEPIPRAVKYLRASLLPNGKLARFYELKTNRPIYFVRGAGGKGFELSYEGNHASSNYGWEWDSELESIENVHAQLAMGEKVRFPPAESNRWHMPPNCGDVDSILADLSADGAWLEHAGDRGFIRDAQGRKVKPSGGVIHSDTFAKNVRVLACWLKSVKR